MGPAESEDIEIVPRDRIVESVSRTISSTSQQLTCLFDAHSLGILSNAVSENEYKILELRSRGVKFRCVTEITQANMAECKALMKNFELFHSGNLVASSLISDARVYVGYLLDKTGTNRILRITNLSFVCGQEFLMNAIIDKAQPAKQRLVEIVKGMGNEFIETIRDPVKTKSLVIELVNSAVYEINILFSTKNSFIMAEKEGILEQLGQASRRGIKVKILVMNDETVKVISDSKIRAPYEDVQVNYLQQFLPTKITTIIIDQSKSLTIEVNDDSKDTLADAIGLSTYSNSESTVFSNASIFESLWIQAELDKQNHARQAYFQLFKGFKLKDEIYDRKWRSAQGTSGDTPAGT